MSLQDAIESELEDKIKNLQSQLAAEIEANRWKKQVPDKEGHWLRVNAAGRIMHHSVFKDSTLDDKLSIYWGWSPTKCCLVKEIQDKLSYFYWYGPIAPPKGE